LPKKQLGSLRLAPHAVASQAMQVPVEQALTVDSGGFGLAVELDVVIPTLEHDAALALVEKAHEVCPYSNATRCNVDVKLQVV